MSESRRDAGLIRAVGTWAFAASIINVIIGAGIFAAPSALAASVGPYAPFAFVVAAIAIGSVAICFAEGGSRIPTSGGPYGYIEAAFGPMVGYVAGTLLWFGNALAGGGIVAALGDVAGSVAPASLVTPVRVVVIAGTLAVVAAVNLGGVARGTRLAASVTGVKLVPLVIFVIAGAFAIHTANFHRTTELATQGLGRALILALFAFTGMEVSLGASGEVVDPARAIPRALATAMAVVAGLYIFVQVIAQGILGPALATSPAPLPDAMGRINPALRVIMLAGAAASMFGYAASDIVGTPRILFGMARDGLLPRVLGRVNERSHTPQIAIVSYAALVLALALSGTFAELAVLSSLATAVLYIGGCAAAWSLAGRGAAEAGPPLGFRWLGGAAAVGIVSMIGLIALASRSEIIGLAALLAVALVAYLLISRRRSASPGV